MYTVLQAPTQKGNGQSEPYSDDNQITSRHLPELPACETKRS